MRNGFPAMIPVDGGSRLMPASGGAPRQVVLLLHGYGSNGADLIGLAPHWQPALPNALFLAPDAPQRCPGTPDGYQWWSLSDFSAPARAAGVTAAAPALDAYIDAQLAQYGLSEDKLVLVGFSQGTMLALHVGLRRTAAVAGIVGYSGMLIDAGPLPPVARPPVLLVHGAADAVVPVAALNAAHAELQRLGCDVGVHVSPGLGHSIDPTGLRLGTEFLGRVLHTGT